MFIKNCKQDFGVQIKSLYSVSVELFIELCLGTIEILKDLYSGSIELYKIALTRGYRRYIRAIEYSNNLSRSLFRLVQVAISVAVVILLINLTSFYFATETDPVSFGSFGDFFGGMLNPIFTFLMLVSLVVTIVLQKTELSLARKEFKRTADSMQLQNQNLEVQRFENTFFKLIEHYEHCRDDVEYKSFHGRDAIKQMYEYFTREKLSERKHDIEERKIEIMFKDKCKEISGVQQVYDEFYHKYGEELGQYYRTLYHILNFIENTKIIKNKEIYSKLIRSQLSRYELLLLFYNTISSHGWDKMRPLVQNFDIMKHLEIELLPDENKDLISLVRPPGTGILSSPDLIGAE